MAEKVILSPKYSLQLRDFLKGALLAVITAVFPIIQSSLEKGELSFNWKLIATVSASAFIAYIAKNFFFEPTQVTTVYDSKAKAEIVAENIKEQNA